MYRVGLCLGGESMSAGRQRLGNHLAPKQSASVDSTERCIASSVAIYEHLDADGESEAP
jgi:hypothetical protein